MFKHLGEDDCFALKPPRESCVRKWQFWFICVVLGKNRKFQIHRKTKNAIEGGVMSRMALAKRVMTTVTAEAVVTDSYSGIACASCCSKQFIFKESVPSTVI